MLGKFFLSPFCCNIHEVLALKKNNSESKFHLGAQLTHDLFLAQSSSTSFVYTS